MVFTSILKQSAVMNRRASNDHQRRFGIPISVKTLILLLLACSANGLEPLELNVAFTRDLVRAYDGIDNFNFERIETRLSTPLITKRSYAGNWLVGADFTENRLFLTGAITGTRRLYRFATPIQFFPRSVGRIQHEWMLTPAYYSDESLTDQKRFNFEYAWQARYRKNRKVSFVAGLRNDSRFGGEGIHPIFGLESKPNEHIFHHWVFPDMYTNVSLNRKTSVRAFLQVNGGNWRYLQSDETSTASLGVSDWKLGMSFRLRTRMPFDIVAEAGMRILGSGAISGTTGSLDNSFFVGIGINTPFSMTPQRQNRRPR